MAVYGYEAFSFGFHQSDMRTAQILGKRTSIEKAVGGGAWYKRVLNNKPFG